MLQKIEDPHLMDGLQWKLRKVKWMIRGYWGTLILGNSHIIGYSLDMFPLYESTPNRNPAWYLIATCWTQHVAGISELCWIPIYILCLNHDDNMYPLVN